MKKLCLNLIMRVSSWFVKNKTLCAVVVGACVAFLYHSIVCSRIHCAIESCVGLGIATTFVVLYVTKTRSLPIK